MANKDFYDHFQQAAKPLIGYRPPHTSQDTVAKLRHLDHLRQEEYINGLKAKVQRDTQEINYGIPAVRGWRVSSGGYLHSVSASYEYQDTIARSEHKPDLFGSNGFWALKPSGLNILKDYWVTVVGIVELSGTVIEHELGWRAEVCVIQSLYVLPPRIMSHLLSELGEDWQERVIRLGNLYQCDTYPISDIESFREVCFR